MSCFGSSTWSSVFSSSSSSQYRLGLSKDPFSMAVAMLLRYSFLALFKTCESWETHTCADWPQVGLVQDGSSPYTPTTYSRWYDHDWLKADYKPDSSIHLILVRKQRVCLRRQGRTISCSFFTSPKPITDLHDCVVSATMFTGFRGSVFILSKKLLYSVAILIAYSRVAWWDHCTCLLILTLSRPDVNCSRTHFSLVSLDILLKTLIANWRLTATTTRLNQLYFLPWRKLMSTPYCHLDNVSK